MYCKYCGKWIADESNFCKFCGKDLSDGYEEKLKEAQEKIKNLEETISEKKALYFLFALLMVGGIALLYFTFDGEEILFPIMGGMFYLSGSAGLIALKKID